MTARKVFQCLQFLMWPITDDFAKLYVLGGLSFFTWRNSEQPETTMILFQMRTDFSLFFSEKVRHDT